MRRPLLACLCAASLAAADGYGPVLEDARMPMLGVGMTPVPTAVMDQEGLPPGRGVQVTEVFSGTAAAQMGLQKNDIILAVNDQPIGSMTDLRNEVGLSQPGDPVQVTVLRNGLTSIADATLKPWPEHIPYTPLDAAAEKRFRDWQERRQQRLADEARQLSGESAALARQLDDEADPAGPGEAGRPDAGLGLPAFRLRLRVPVDPTRTAEAAEAEAGGPAFADDPGHGAAWTARLRIASTR